jgi:osmotically-inducible protein OsmY
MHIGEGFAVKHATTCAALAILLTAGIGAAQTRSDNTATNKADRSATAVTADEQSNRKADLETTRKIRHAIVTDKSLSAYAHNVKIVTTEGKVTLRGPVRTEAEKETVQAKAAEIAGATNIVNDVSVVPTKTRRAK